MNHDIDALVSDLTIDEKASLTVGASMWTTHAVERRGIPSITVTDGPAGARGPFIPGIGSQVSTLCIPCGSALGATFDVELLYELGEALGQQSRTKGARVLLAPTVNLHRSPLFGRHFECYSEDPLLSGLLASSFIRGVQSQGVATTVKHFVGNDAEFERMTIDSVIDQRTLREIYLLPFEMAVREGGTLGIMTSYNRLNGTYCSEDRELLTDILRHEWGFEGFVVTDWFAGATTAGAARAGLDLEMPAPARAYGRFLADAVRAGDVDEEDLNRAVRTLLSVFNRLGALDDDPVTPQAVDVLQHRDLARRAARASMVLLKNDPVQGSPLLPLNLDALRSVAVIGPNAGRARIMGGGSAEVQPHHRTAIIDVLRNSLGDAVTVAYEAGCHIDKTTPAIDPDAVRTPAGDAGFSITVYDGSPATDSSATAPVLTTLERADGRLVVVARNDPGVPTSGFHFTAEGLVTVRQSGDYLISLVELSPCQLFIDDTLTIDGQTLIPPRGSAFFGMGSEEMTTTVNLVADQDYRFRLNCDGTAKQWAHGAEVGMRLLDSGDSIQRAVELAARSDVALVIVGTTDDWESEGHDRESLSLPGQQDELIRAVRQANERTIVLVNTGSPVDMAWADDVAAVMQIWFGGQEMGPAVADVLLGTHDPGGRLPTSIPWRIEDTPAFGNFPGEHGQIRYGEGLLMGYRWYDTRQIPVRFPFGHGLSYTSFDIGPPEIDHYELTTHELSAHELSAHELSAHELSTHRDLEATDAIHISVPVTNTGNRHGSHVVQVYVSPRSPSVQRPLQELKAVAKVDLAPGARQLAHLTLPARAFAYWEPGDHYRGALKPNMTGQTTINHDRRRGHWHVEPGLYDIKIGSSSQVIHHTATVTIHPISTTMHGSGT